MSFGRSSNLWRTVAFRLTLTYAVIFTASALVFLGVLYAMVLAGIRSRTDDDLRSSSREIAAELVAKGTEGLRAALDTEAAGEGGNRVFLRVFDASGSIVATSDLSSWQHLPEPGSRPPDSRGMDFIFRDVPMSGRRLDVRVLETPVGSGMLLQIGRSMDHDVRSLKGGKRVAVSSTLLVLTLAALAGWFLARRALSGVEKVTQTAIAITGGAFDERVPLRGTNDEIDRLAATFNDMLGRIQALITGMKEITDNVAHDLRSPITRMRGLAELTLLRQLPDQDYEAVAASTVEECDRLLGTINTMLAISEAETGMAKLALADFDLAETARDVCDLFSPVAEEKGVALSVSAPAGIALRGDLQMIQRALSDLVDNAVKYTPRGGEVTVTAEGGDASATVTVRDTGIGIAAGDLPRIFERFYRADRSRLEQGSGLGLSLARAVVRAHGGEIVVTSALGEGSTFRLTLPRIAAGPHRGEGKDGPLG